MWPFFPTGEGVHPSGLERSETNVTFYLTFISAGSHIETQVSFSNENTLQKNCGEIQNTINSSQKELPQEFPHIQVSETLFTHLIDKLVFLIQEVWVMATSVTQCFAWYC